MAYTYKYPRPAVTADCIVITKEPDPKVLLIERGDEPFKGCWAFPGGFMNMDETTEQCAIRELEEETGLKVSKVYQIGAYSKVDRDPRGRTITVAYLAIIDEPITVVGQDDAAEAKWWPLSDLPHLAFDHCDIMQDAIRLYSDFLLKQLFQEVFEIACPQHLPIIGLLAEVRDTQFPIDLEKAYELGKRLVAKCKESQGTATKLIRNSKGEI